MTCSVSCWCHRTPAPFSATKYTGYLESGTGRPRAYCLRLMVAKASHACPAAHSPGIIVDSTAAWPYRVEPASFTRRQPVYHNAREDQDIPSKGAGEDPRWTELHRARFRSWVLLLAMIIAWLAALPLSEELFGRTWPGYVIVGVLAVAWLVQVERVRHFPCPRCGAPFFHGAFWFNTSASQCVHCGLPRGATLDAH
jgi:ribosomal protein L37E